MPRRPREEEPGAIHHVYARAVTKRALYRDRVDREHYLELLEDVVDSHSWWCLGYCQMDTHVHLLIETPEANLGRGMHRLHGEYAVGFNRRHGLTGHVFESRYHAVRVRTDAHLLVVAAYVVNNPVEARMVRRPDDWPWSSYRATLDDAGPSWLASARLHEYFGSWGGDGRERFLGFAGQAA